MANQFKEFLDKETYLLFVEDGDKWRFLSNNPVLQKWIDGVKNKKIKRDAVKYVVREANKYMKNPQKFLAQNPTNQERASVNKSPNGIKTWQTDPISSLNLYCQQKGLRLPQYQTIDVEQSRGTQIVTVRMITPEGKEMQRAASSAKEAKRMLASAYAKDELKVDALQNKKEQEQKPAVAKQLKPVAKTSAPKGYYKVGKERYSVTKNGDVYHLPRTRVYTFLCADLWMGQEGDKLTLFFHSQELASLSCSEQRYREGKKVVYAEDKWIYRDSQGGILNADSFYNAIAQTLQKHSVTGNYPVYRAQNLSELENAKLETWMRPATADEIVETLQAVEEDYRLKREYQNMEQNMYRPPNNKPESYYWDKLDMIKDDIAINDAMIHSNDDFKIDYDERMSKAKEKISGHKEADRADAPSLADLSHAFGGNATVKKKTSKTYE